MKKYSWITALLMALTLGFVFLGCDDGTGGDGAGPRAVAANMEFTDKADIRITAIGNTESMAAATVKDNTYLFNKTGGLSSAGFYVAFPKDAVGKPFKYVEIEMRLLEPDVTADDPSPRDGTSPKFISLNAKANNQMAADVLIVGHTQQYHNEFKFGHIVDKNLKNPCSSACLKYTVGSTYTKEQIDDLIKSTEKTEAELEEEGISCRASWQYPYSSFPNGYIAFQYNPWAGDIADEDPSWTSSGLAKFKIEVTKLSFIGGGAEPDPHGIGDVLFEMTPAWLARPAGDGNGPFTGSGSVTITRDSSGVEYTRGGSNSWDAVDFATGGFNVNLAKYGYKVTITASMGEAGRIRLEEAGSPYRQYVTSAALAADESVTLTGYIPGPGTNVRINSTGVGTSGTTVKITGFKVEVVEVYWTDWKPGNDWNTLKSDD